MRLHGPENLSLCVVLVKAKRSSAPFSSQETGSLTQKSRCWEKKKKEKKSHTDIYRRDLYLLIKRPGRAGNSLGVKEKGIAVREESL